MTLRYRPAEPLHVKQLKPAWTRVMLLRYVLRLRQRIRELERTIDQDRVEWSRAETRIRELERERG